MATAYLTLTKLRFVLCVIFLSIIVAALYSFSGLPKPQRVSAEAQHRRAQLNLMVLAGAVQGMTKESGSTPDTWDDFVAFCRSESVTIDLNQLQKEGVGESMFRSLSSKTEIGGVLLQGQMQDEYGLVWALTDKGFVIKVPMVSTAKKSARSGVIH